jgi:hypothetical protein
MILRGALFAVALAGAAQAEVPNFAAVSEDIQLIREWIAQGARDAEGAAASMPTGGRIRLRGILTGSAEIDGATCVMDGNTGVDDTPRIGGQA